MKRFVLVASALAFTFAVFLANRVSPPGSPGIRAGVTGLQAAADTGFARALQPRALVFPRDHGPHPEYQTEWWYYTGNLDSSEGRHWGYQLTLFRRALTPVPIARLSDWGTNQIYFAHLAITDVRANSHYATERFSRGAAGLAGATGTPYNVWIENWDIAALDGQGDLVRLKAHDSGYGIDLTLTSLKPAILHGENGLSPKSGEPGNASYYYSLTRLATEGTVQIEGQTLAATGLSWMDHEFGTTLLGPDAAGWDWFSIQLSDDREIMFFQIRQKDGSIEPVSGGTLVEKDGTSRRLSLAEVQIKTGGTWTSSSGATYPARWEMAIPSAGIQLSLHPYVPDQEMRVSVIYWEGAVEFSGRSNGAPVTGAGYVELTGYATSSQVPR